MISLAGWQASLAAAVDEAERLAGHLYHEVHDTDSRSVLAGTATLIRTVAEMRGLDEMAEQARVVAVIASEDLNHPRVALLQAVMRRLRGLAQPAVAA